MKLDMKAELQLRTGVVLTMISQRFGDSDPTRPPMMLWYIALKVAAHMICTDFREGPGGAPQLDHEIEQWAESLLRDKEAGKEFSVPEGEFAHDAPFWRMTAKE